jgi:hypothetical protein
VSVRQRVDDGLTFVAPEQIEQLAQSHSSLTKVSQWLVCIDLIAIAPTHLFRLEVTFDP